MTDNPGRPAAEAPARTAPSPAPGRLRWIEELVNTRSVETGSDEIPTPALLGNWLRDRRLLPAGVPVTADEHDRAVRIRAGLRELIAANNAGPAAGNHAHGSRASRRVISGPALADLAGLARRLPLVLDVDGRRPCLLPVSRNGGHGACRLARGRRGVGGQRHLGPAEDMQEPGLPVGLLRPVKEPVSGLVLDGRVRQPGQGQGLPQPQPPMAGVSREASGPGWRG